MKHLLFRNYLCTHLKDAQEYYKLKKRLAFKSGSDHEAYTGAKMSFVESIIAKAKLE